MRLPEHKVAGLERRLYEHWVSICNVKRYVHQEMRETQSLMQCINACHNSQASFSKFSNMGSMLKIAWKR
jgi:hypothetical protein